MSRPNFVEDFLKRHKEIEKLNSLELLMFIIQLNKLVDRLNDILLNKIVEELKNAKK